MTRSTTEKRRVFRALHADGCFILPNPWDIGSARLLQSLGFEALASTSTGYAWTQGWPDYDMQRDAVLQHLTSLSTATSLPLNADFESGFAADGEALAKNVVLGVETGVSGLSIEDRKFGDVEHLYSNPESAERIRVAKAAITSTGEDVILVGRTEGLLVGGSVKDAIDKLVVLADAGADCLYAPGIGMPGLSSLGDVATLVRAVAPLPVNILVSTPGVTKAQLEDLGVRRISIGGALSLVGWRAVRDAAARIKDGDFDGLGAGMPGAELNTLFASEV
ncbi:MAG: 2-methylisocitrate lyase [Bradyrhizobium sp.]|nr:2-methylisocitrate lyase [Bradyrhizobium sp.]